MAGFDYDVVIIGSGFGGSVAALRAAEKGYRVGVMESGKRWRDEDIPRPAGTCRRFLWFPAAELYGIQRMEYLDDVLVLCGAGVGGGSHVYGNTLYVPPQDSSSTRPEWAGITDWADELAPCYRSGDGGCSASSATRTCPPTWTGTCARSPIEMGTGEHVQQGAGRRLLRHARRRGRRSLLRRRGAPAHRMHLLRQLQIGCGHNAKNKLTTNYLYLAEKLGAEVHELTRCTTSTRSTAAGSRCTPATPVGRSAAAHLHRHTYTAEQVIVAAHAYGSAKLLHHMQHKGRLPDLSSQLGQRARTNSEQLLVDHADATASGSAIRRGSTSRRDRSRSPRACGRTR